LIAIITLYFFETDDPQKVALSKKIDRISFFSIVSLYAIINAVLIYGASS
jgi:hypothetical protein